MSGPGLGPTTSRLERALSAWLRWRDAVPPESAEALLAAHPDLRDLLEPMLDEPAAVPAEPDAAAGRMLGEFLLRRELGRGGMGVVYEAVQLSLNRRVAVKVLPAHLTLQPAAIARFQREAETAAKLRHPGIVAVHAVASDRDLHWFAMDLVDGAPLDAVLRRLAALPRNERSGRAVLAAVLAEMQQRGHHAPEPAGGTQWDRRYVEVVVSLHLQVADALAHAHRAGVVHRDVKPSNILVRPDGTAVLTDFGLAREQGPPSLTMTGDFAGTPHYVAPEQIQARPGQLDGRADVFSLGATLYEALTFARAFDGRTSHEVLARVADVDPTDPQRLNPELAPDLAAIVLHSLEKDRARRYAGAAEFAADLQAFLDYRPVAARRVTRRERMIRWMRRNPIVAALAAVLVVALLGGAGVVLRQNVALARSVANYVRMSDVQLAQQYVENRFTLDAYDPRHRHAIDRWLAVAHGLASRRLQHEARLAEIRARALPYDAEDRARDRREHPLAAEHDGLQREAESLAVGIERMPDEMRPKYRRALELIRLRIAELAPRVQERVTWRFADPALQWEHDTLVVLLRLLDDLTDPRGGSLPAVERWRERVETILERTIDAPRAQWERVIAEVADPAACPEYRGLRLRPQSGLVPLGRDPLSGLHEFAHLASGEPPLRAADGTLQVTAESAIVLVLLPGGSARLGSRPAQPEDADGQDHVDSLSSDRECPVHEVELDPFFIGKHETTVGQLQRAVGLERGAIWRSRYPERVDLQVDRMPVETITPAEAEAAMRACGLALPTEAQWEYAARAGSTTPWYTGRGPESLHGRANVADRAYLAHQQKNPQDGHPGWRLEDGWVLVAPAGEFPPNPFGLHDMIGNVAEIVRGSSVLYTVAAEPGDGMRPGGAADMQMVRGGSFVSNPAEARSAHRDRTGRHTRLTSIGFRAARALSRD